MTVHDPRARGLVPSGDSITRGGGQSMPGLRMQSWALWLAEALELPFTCLARDGARARTHWAVRCLGCAARTTSAVSISGSTTSASRGSSSSRTRRRCEEVVAAVDGCSERLLLVALPPTLGVPQVPSHAIAAANEEIERLAREHGAVLVTSRRSR